jgi:hypothetical protein
VAAATAGQQGRGCRGLTVSSCSTKAQGLRTHLGARKLIGGVKLSVGRSALEAQDGHPGGRGPRRRPGGASHVAPCRGKYEWGRGCEEEGKPRLTSARVSLWPRWCASPDIDSELLAAHLAVSFLPSSLPPFLSPARSPSLSAPTGDLDCQEQPLRRHSTLLANVLSETTRDFGARRPGG